MEVYYTAAYSKQNAEDADRTENKYLATAPTKSKVKKRSGSENGVHKNEPAQNLFATSSPAPDVYSSSAVNKYDSATPKRRYYRSNPAPLSVFQESTEMCSTKELRLVSNDLTPDAFCTTYLLEHQECSTSPKGACAIPSSLQSSPKLSLFKAVQAVKAVQSEQDLSYQSLEPFSLCSEEEQSSVFTDQSQIVANCDKTTTSEYGFHCECISPIHDPALKKVPRISPKQGCEQCSKTSSAAKPTMPFTPTGISSKDDFPVHRRPRHDCSSPQNRTPKRKSRRSPSQCSKNCTTVSSPTDESILYSVTSNTTNEDRLLHPCSKPDYSSPPPHNKAKSIRLRSPRVGSPDRKLGTSQVRDDKIETKTETETVVAAKNRTPSVSKTKRRFLLTPRSADLPGEGNVFSFNVLQETQAVPDKTSISDTEKSKDRKRSRGSNVEKAATKIPPVNKGSKHSKTLSDNDVKTNNAKRKPSKQKNTVKRKGADVSNEPDIASPKESDALKESCKPLVGAAGTPSKPATNQRRRKNTSVSTAPYTGSKKESSRSPVKKPKMTEVATPTKTPRKPSSSQEVSHSKKGSTGGNKLAKSPAKHPSGFFGKPAIEKSQHYIRYEFDMEQVIAGLKITDDWKGYIKRVEERVPQMSRFAWMSSIIHGFQGINPCMYFDREKLTFMIAQNIEQINPRWSTDCQLAISFAEIATFDIAKRMSCDPDFVKSYCLCQNRPMKRCSWSKEERKKLAETFKAAELSLETVKSKLEDRSLQKMVFSKMCLHGKQSRESRFMASLRKLLTSKQKEKRKTS